MLSLRSVRRDSRSNNDVFSFGSFLFIHAMYNNERKQAGARGRVILSQECVTRDAKDSDLEAINIFVL